MLAPILATKLHTPAPRPRLVLRPRLLERLDAGMHRGLTLVSAPAGFGKTTLVSAWVASCGRPAAWLSLDEGDSDATRFLTYLVAALQTIRPGVGAAALSALQAPQPPPPEAILTTLLNDAAAIAERFVLVLDDYHLVDSRPVDRALALLIERLPPRMHLVIATREDPQLPLARLRARDQLTELRAADLRFTPAEAAGFLNQIMELNLAAGEVAALEARTEGWIAGLQLAAISLQGRADSAGFIRSFAGGHHFVLDYLVEEVLHRQPEGVQTFLLGTSMLNRLCGPLCDAVLRDAGAPGQATLEYLERANLFIVPLDDERRWYRYHHLFADVLRQRLARRAGREGALHDTAELHRRASEWFEGQGLELEAFHHAAAAGDLDRAARLVEGAGMPLIFRGAALPVLSWLESLPDAARDARPSLWVLYASALLFVGRLGDVERRLQAAEATLHGEQLDDRARDLVGHIAAIRATLAVSQHQAATIIEQSRRALAHLHPENLPVRTATTWTLGYAHQLEGDRAAAGRAYAESIAISQRIGHFIIHLMATIGLAAVQEAENQLALAAETYRRAVELAGEPPTPAICEAHLGLARIAYEWNDLDAAERHARRGVELARQVENTDRVVAGQIVLARLRLARGDLDAAAALLDEAEQSVRSHSFTPRLPEVADARVPLLLRRRDLRQAARLAEAHELPLGRARVHLAQGDPSAALAALEPALARSEARGWADERLRLLALQALAHHARGDAEPAARLLEDALALAAPGRFTRLFADEGAPMAELLTRLRAGGAGARKQIDGLLAAFELGGAAEPRAEPLSDRELAVLRLIAEGLSNHQIGERLFLALSTVKGHNRNIFGKLQVQRRTEAVARARELGLL
jgi:LuxR family transcriptional regulator, maltose regulon positive regulatory protein